MNIKITSNILIYYTIVLLFVMLCYNIILSTANLYTFFFSELDFYYSNPSQTANKYRNKKQFPCKYFNFGINI